MISSHRKHHYQLNKGHLLQVSIFDVIPKQWQPIIGFMG
jgi:hypothetical protein